MSSSPSLLIVQDPKACTILLRGASKDVLNEVERNLRVFLALSFTTGNRAFFGSP
jgi:hypothetical protein